MRVFKFGGASVKDAEGIINLYNIVSEESSRLVVVVSALGKTTNALEKLHAAWRGRNPAVNSLPGVTEEYQPLSGGASDFHFLPGGASDFHSLPGGASDFHFLPGGMSDYDAIPGGISDYHSILGEISDYHFLIAEQLFGKGAPEYQKFKGIFSEFGRFLQEKKPGDFDHDYDMIVSHGEIWSTIIVEAYLRSRGLNSVWVDARKMLITDDRYRDAGILWEESGSAVKEYLDFSRADIYVTQGFIGSTSDGEATTLGREGSDYTAALIANMLDASDVVVWKDVPGIMNADPDWMPAAVTLPHISYHEAVEMTYSGAKVIHPKTIKPLHNKKIPMFVKSFADRSAAGTLISDDAPQGEMCPVFVRKERQMLLSLIPKDLSFVMGDNLAKLFRLLSQAGLKVNLVQTGAVSINICIDHEEPKVSEVISELKEDYTILYNDGAEMLTVRHCTPEAASLVTGTREVLLSQKTRNTVRMVVR
ncbi:MAG: aspartate kinase [Actinomycetota bacterium]